MTSAPPCSLCSVLADTDQTAPSFVALQLLRSTFARNPSTGSRLDAFRCVECATRWLLEISEEGKILDWFVADEPSRHEL